MRFARSTLIFVTIKLRYNPLYLLVARESDLLFAKELSSRSEGIDRAGKLHGSRLVPKEGEI